VFSHIVFQHMPRKVASSYFAEVARVLRPGGGDFLFQMPEVGPDTPQDPPEADTFEMRFYTEDDLRDQLAAHGLQWVDVRRFEAGDDSLRFHQLRVHVRR